MRLAHILLSTAVATLGVASTVLAQTDAPPSPGVLKVFLSCDSCDKAHIKTTLGFAEFVDDRNVAEVEAALATTGAPAEQRWTLTLTGRGRFEGQTRTISFDVAAAVTPEQLRSDIDRFLKLGLAEYAAASSRGRELDLSFRRPAAGSSTAQKDQTDPWNYWVFRVGMNAFADGEKSTSSGQYFLNGSANRTTDAWKVRFSVSRSVNRSSFDLGDGEKVKTRLTDWNTDSLIVKSLGPHWSAGLTSSVVGSTFSNSKLVVRVSPAAEYDLFPYTESTKRSLTIQYSVGPAHYGYEEETIFSKLSDNVLQHAVVASLGLRQPWGQVGTSANFTQQLNALERTRLTIQGSMNIRLLKSLTLNSSGSYARIRDQFTLAKGEATEEEVLLRQRQLATGYRYSFSLGFGYSFGALSNATVNPRFGGS